MAIAPGEKICRVSFSVRTVPPVTMSETFRRAPCADIATVAATSVRTSAIDARMRREIV